jgi:hypothetical protein
MSVDHCTAQQIEVQSVKASNTQETDCDIFMSEGQA